MSAQTSSPNLNIYQQTNTLNLNEVQLEILWSIVEDQFINSRGNEKKSLEAILNKIRNTKHIAGIRQRWAAE